jgi:hypothetical protein
MTSKEEMKSCLATKMKSKDTIMKTWLAKEEKLEHRNKELWLLILDNIEYEENKINYKKKKPKAEFMISKSVDYVSQLAGSSIYGRALVIGCLILRPLA